MSTSPTDRNAVEPYEDDAAASQAPALNQSARGDDTRAERDERIFPTSEAKDRIG